MFTRAINDQNNENVLLLLFTPYGVTTCPWAGVKSYTDKFYKIINFFIVVASLFSTCLLYFKAKGSQYPILLYLYETTELVKYRITFS